MAITVNLIIAMFEEKRIQKIVGRAIIIIVSVYLFGYAIGEAWANFDTNIIR